MTVPLEIERKFLIGALDPAAPPLRDAPFSQITQVYLLAASGVEERVRCRVRDGVAQYTHTVKREVSRGVREELETVITSAEYETLVERADPDRVPVVKTRWEIVHGGVVWEADHVVSPRELWLLEVELADSAALDGVADLPPGIDVIREVTGVKEFGNAALARRDTAAGRSASV